jgi:hypothetical protein
MLFGRKTLGGFRLPEVTRMVVVLVAASAGAWGLLWHDPKDP